MVVPVVTETVDLKSLPTASSPDGGDAKIAVYVIPVPRISAVAESQYCITTAGAAASGERWT